MSDDAPAGTAARALVRAARPEDAAGIHALMRGLAEYEKLMHEFTSTEQDLTAALFSNEPAAECLVLEQDGALTGYALFYPVFSSFRNRRTLWLEDLFVDPAARGTGGGKLLMTVLARICLERGITRLGWIVLDWNEPSIAFYKRLGGAEQPTKEWLTYAMGEAELRRLAGQAAWELQG
jgi:GNAT superfamily N-acetyltransferase